MMRDVPSGYVKIAIENGPFIVELPMKMVVFHSYVSLPEGTNFSPNILEILGI